MKPAEFKVKELLDATGRATELTDREKHLVGLAVTITRGCTACTGGRIEKAMASGIDYETIRSAIDLVAAVNAGVALRTAIEGADAVAACSGSECTIGTPDSTNVAQQ